MPKFDHHLHTFPRSPDSILEPWVLIERARATGLDGVVITEHDYQWTPDELSDLAAQADGLKVFAGAEISAREGHFLVYGLPDLEDAPCGIALAKLLQVVRRHDAAIVAAHPFRWGQDFTAIIAAHGPVFAALELVSNNVTRETRQKTERLLREHPMGATGSSDAHDPETIGCYFTEFPGRIEALADFVAALRQGTGRPRHRQDARLASGPIT